MQDEAKGKRRTVEEIDADIARTKEELENVRGRECEVYARIVGYYRSVRGWNNGKREEYGMRKMFRQDNEAAARRLPGPCGSETAPMAHVEKEATA